MVDVERFDRSLAAAVILDGIEWGCKTSMLWSCVDMMWQIFQKLESCCTVYFGTEKCVACSQLLQYVIINA